MSHLVHSGSWLIRSVIIYVTFGYTSCPFRISDVSVTIGYTVPSSLVYWCIMSHLDILTFPGSLAQWWLMAYWTHFTVPSSLVLVRNYVTVGYTSLRLPLYVIHVVFGHTSLFRPHLLYTYDLCHIWIHFTFSFILSFRDDCCHIRYTSLFHLHKSVKT